MKAYHYELVNVFAESHFGGNPLAVFTEADGLTPLDWQIRQGDEIGRPNRLTLKVDAAQKIYVGGKVIKVGEGQFFVPSE